MTRHSLALAAAILVTALSASPALAQSKKELVARILQLQQPDTEALARQVAERPLVQASMVARQALANMPAEKRESAAKAFEADAKKYLDEAVPLLRDRAIKLAPSTLGAEYEKNFNEEELKQIIAWMESPVIKRLQQNAPNMMRSFAEQLVADTKGQIEPKLKTLEQAMARDLGLPAAGAGGASGAGGGTGAPMPGNRGK
jgi:hypothetical protein